MKAPDLPRSEDELGPDETYSSKGTRYKFGDSLGEGGMGLVLEAHDMSLNRLVAIKRIRPEFAKHKSTCKRFLTEATIMANLEHPGSIPVYEAGRLASGEYYYAMKKVKGRTLQDILSERGGVKKCCAGDQGHLLGIFERVCDAMAYAHSKGVVHRDLKPENIMVDDFGAVFVMDWGLSKRIEDISTAEAEEGEGLAESRKSDAWAMDGMKTAAGTVQGTPNFMSPEQIQTPDRVGYPSDVYALGIVLYEILTDVLPFAGSTSVRIFDNVIKNTPPEPRAVLPSAGYELSAICMKAIEKDPADRYPSAKELAADIRAYREDLPVSAAPPRLRDRLGKAARRHPIATGALAAAAVLAMIWGATEAKEAFIDWQFRRKVLASAERNSKVMRVLERQLAEVEKKLVTGLSSEELKKLLQEKKRIEGLLDFVEESSRSGLLALLGRNIWSPDPEVLESVRRAQLAKMRRDLARDDYWDVVYMFEMLHGRHPAAKFGGQSIADADPEHRAVLVNYLGFTPEERKALEDLNNRARNALGL